MISIDPDQSSQEQQRRRAKVKTLADAPEQTKEPAPRVDTDCDDDRYDNIPCTD